tara:strand:- start:1625 stop:1978 length:354 start_codon:yes stop_codon:yes gene_type:complete
MNKYYNEVSETIQGIVNNGFELIKVDYDRGYGETEGEDYIDCSAGNIGEAVDAVLAVDDCHLYLKTPSSDEVWVYFVLGNEPGECVNDWVAPSDLNERSALNAAISEVYDKYQEVAK